MREILITGYLDYLNNYLSFVTWGEHNGLTPDQAEAFILLAKQVINSEHPDK